jgi:hypothetical protein
VHLDIDVADIDAAEREVVAHGGAPLRSYDGWRVYADPAGHPFCLIGRPVAAATS